MAGVLPSVRDDDVLRLMTFEEEEVEAGAPLAELPGLIATLRLYYKRKSARAKLRLESDKDTPIPVPVV